MLNVFTYRTSQMCSLLIIGLHDVQNAARKV